LATLNNKKIKDTFKGLLKTLDNAEITGQVEITDGDGNQTGVFINTDGSIKVTGTTEFGSLKDTGEDITITKFVDEADGISNNDDDSSIPTSAAVKDYVDINVTAQDLDFQGDGGTGAVDLDSQSLDIAGGTGITTSALDQTLTIDIDNTVATLSDTQTLTNKSIDLTNNTITGTTSQFNTALSDDNFATLAGTDTLTNKTINADNNTVSNIETDNLKAGVLDTDLSSVSASDDTLASAKAIKTYVDTQITAEDLDFSGDTGSGSVDLDSQTLSITGTGIASTTAADQVLAVNVPATNLSNTPASTTLDVESSTGNNTTLPAATITNAGVMTGADKTKLDGIEDGAEVNVVTSVNTETGDVVLDTDDVSEGTSNLYYTDSRADERVDLQTGTNLDLSQKSTSNLSEGTNLYYTEDRVSANTNVAANTLKNSYPTVDSTKVGFISVTQAVDLDTMESNIETNNAKNSYPSADATKVGFISVTQAVDLDTIENDVATNNAKISFDSASSAKLAGIEDNADVTDTANVTSAGALMDSEVDADIKTLSLPANTTISSFAQSFLDDADAATVRTTIGAGTSNLELGTTSTTALAGDTTTITTQQATDIQTNNAKVSNVTTDLSATANGTSLTINSSDGTDASVPAATTSAWGAMTDEDKTKLDGIATGATANVGTVTEVTVGTGLDVTNGTTTPALSLDLSEFTDMTADMIETDEFIVLDGGAERRKAINEVKSTLFSNNDLYKVIGVATDHSSRVLSDSGTSEGATSIMQNFEILINN
jgi:Fe-S-cluster formation regulator IscX/YfhJ